MPSLSISPSLLSLISSQPVARNLFLSFTNANATCEQTSGPVAKKAVKPVKKSVILAVSSLLLSLSLFSPSPVSSYVSLHCSYLAVTLSHTFVLWFALLFFTRFLSAQDTGSVGGQSWLTISSFIPFNFRLPLLLVMFLLLLVLPLIAKGYTHLHDRARHVDGNLPPHFTYVVMPRMRATIVTTCVPTISQDQC